MRLHFAGSDAQENFNELLRRGGAANRLESYYALSDRSAPSQGFTTLLDSGGFVARTKGVQIEVSGYADFINYHRVPYAFNLDTNDPDETDANLLYLVQHCPLATVIPVWHGSDWPGNKAKLGLLVERFGYIGIGGLVGGSTAKAKKQAALDWVFHTYRASVRFHGLGVTSMAWLQRYPWFSVDSTSWLASARYGNRRGDQRVTKFENATYPWQQRTLSEVRRLVAVEEQITRLWEHRGITWSDAA